MKRWKNSIALLATASLAAACSSVEQSPLAGVSAGTARDLVTPQKAYCRGDCLDVMRAGIEWLVRDRGATPNRIVLDTARSGATRSGVRIVPQLVLSSLVAVTGISAGAREDFHDCYRQPLNAPSCQARRQQMLVEMRPPIQNPDTPADARLQLFYSTTRFIPAIGQTRPESRGYELTLRKGATGWVVRSVRLTMIS